MEPTANNAANQITPAGWVRLSLYIISAMVGLAAVIVNVLGMGELSALLGTIAGAGATITGGTAAFNLEKAPDQSRTGGIDVSAAVPAILDIAAAARAYQAAVDYEPRHATEAEDEPVVEPAPGHYPEV